jgi:hypothetical protein
MKDTIPQKALFLVPPLPLVEEAKDKDKKPKATHAIIFVLKQRAGSTGTAPTYKLKVLKGLLQNGLTSVKQSGSSEDRMA